jgi:hypothetical protein
MSFDDSRGEPSSHMEPGSSASMPSGMGCESDPSLTEIVPCQRRSAPPPHPIRTPMLPGGRQAFLANGAGSVRRTAARRVLCANGACPLCCQEELVSDPLSAISGWDANASSRTTTARSKRLAATTAAVGKGSLRDALGHPCPIIGNPCQRQQKKELRDYNEKPCPITMPIALFFGEYSVFLCQRGIVRTPAETASSRRKRRPQAAGRWEK